MEREFLDFLFSARIHLGDATNNYAEYAGLIMCQLVCALHGCDQVTVRSDS